jgi:glutathione S-transferase
LLQEGDRLLSESNAIMCRLSDIGGADFWPHDDRQIEVPRWLFWDTEHFSYHAGRLYFEHSCRSPTSRSASPCPMPRRRRSRTATTRLSRAGTTG